MSYYAVLDDDGKTGGDIATNLGWREFGEWVDALDDSAALKHLRHYGWFDDLDALQADLESAVGTGGSEDVLNIARGLLDMLSDRGNAEVICVTDGC